jgi:ABC-type nitrate/sulfonate/bicarbonate transport system permease component
VATLQARSHVSRRFLRAGKPLGRRTTGLLSFIAFVILWQIIVVTTGVREILLPGPGDVVSEFRVLWGNGNLWPPVLQSLRALSVGLVAGVAIGVVLGLLIGSSRWLDLLAAPYLWAFFATPRIATAPVVILWLGFGFSSKATMVFISALLPVIISCKEGVQTVDESLVQAARSFGASRFDLFRRVVVPFTLPFIANGVRNGIARGFVGLLIIEMTVGSGGIGTQIMRSMRTFNTAAMFAYIVVLVATSLVLITLSRRLEAYASRWREEVYV